MRTNIEEVAFLKKIADILVVEEISVNIHFFRDKLTFLVHCSYTFAKK